MNNYRVLSKEEAEYWSNKIFTSWSNRYNIGVNLLEIYNPDSLRETINYRFTFSVSKNNIQRFENLFLKFLKDGCKHMLLENGYKQYFQIFEYEELDKFRKIEEREEHKIYGVDFIKFTYDFNRSPALATVLFIQIIKDVINIIGEYWGFDENGSEVCSIKYPVGSIVSLTTDKSDFFVESISFIRENTDKFKELKSKFVFKDELLLYNLLKIESNLNSQVLEFSDIYVVSSDTIIPNRGQRIDEILDN